MIREETAVVAGQGTPIVVAMSGGVDSSVAAMLLHEGGWAPIGVSMQVWDYRNHGGCASRATCCAPSDFNDARLVADRLDIPFYVFDFEKTFRAQVIDVFVKSYEEGLTPNPCVECNSKVKFRELRGRAQALGCPYVATGHYARVARDGEGMWRLGRGRDANKDQSYFLYGLAYRELEHTVFPLGELTKPEVRELARQRGLVTADKPESQDICFVSGTVHEFVTKIGRGTKSRGTIVDTHGAVVGEHEGIQGFTVGQRRGLRVGGNAEPVYVLEISPARNQIVVGPRSELAREGFSVGATNWLSPEPLPPGTQFDAVAQLRHRHAGVPVRVTVEEGQRCSARFTGEWTTVSPGQAAVFYDPRNTWVIGGGTIDRL